MKKTVLYIALFAMANAAFAADVFKIDPAHSGINFKIRHFFSKTPGSFTKFEGAIHYDAKDPSKNHAEATIKIPSVDTNNSDRDEHLQQDDYFDAAKYPLMTFKSTEWKATGKSTFDVTGDLTMLGKTNPVTLKVELLGIGEGQGHYKGVLMSGWHGTATIDRTQWGMSSGGPALGDEVEIEINIEAHKK